MRKIIVTILFAFVLFVSAVFALSFFLQDLEKAVNVTSTSVQSLAILVGGFWAYTKFDWEKRAESAIRLKAKLMDYERLHSEAAMQYRIDQSAKKNSMEAWVGYAMKMAAPHNAMVADIHLSCYVPKPIREKLFDVIWFAMSRGNGADNLVLEENWKAFGSKLQGIKDDLDNLATK